MSVKLIAVLECDGCGAVRGHENVNNLNRTARTLRRHASMSGWTTFGSEEQLDECAECGSRAFNAQQITAELPRD